MTKSVLPLLMARAAAASLLGAPACDTRLSTSMRVAWPAVAETDLYYVSLGRSATDRPYALQVPPASPSAHASHRPLLASCAA